MNATERRPRKRAPLRYDWRRVHTVIDREGGEWVEPFTFYRARVNDQTILNAMRVRGSWHWAILHHSAEQTIVDGGTTGTLAEAKVAAENAASPFERQKEIWSERPEQPDADPVPF